MRNKGNNKFRLRVMMNLYKRQLRKRIIIMFIKMINIDDLKMNKYRKKIMLNIMLIVKIL